MKQIIIGLTGWFASGKDSVADYLVQKGFKSYSLSDVIREELTRRGLDHGRDNLQAVANQLREEHGAGYLAEQVLAKIATNKSTNEFVLPSVRTLGEVTVFRKYDGFILINVDATTETRFERLKKRARTADEKNLTFEDFKKKEELEKFKKGGNAFGQQLDKVIEVADIKVDNNGTHKHLFSQIDKTLKEINAD